ncbi:unnamed protein product [Rodentolepis nana]|uniref:LETM1 domain-containing protein n=1 Tax=Rodentolepis nana TaxID=102285 RepID=A0A0R3TAR6_RODNA|nr:unnamed protein product [Rodentolepis nana]
MTELFDLWKSEIKEQMCSGWDSTTYGMNMWDKARSERVEADMDSEAVATLISKRARISRDCLMNAGGVYTELPALCRGSPLAASLLGGLLALPTFVLSSYLGPRGFRSASDDVIIDWSKISLTSWYHYESVEDVTKRNKTCEAAGRYAGLVYLYMISTSIITRAMRYYLCRFNPLCFRIYARLSSDLRNQRQPILDVLSSD